MNKNSQSDIENKNISNIDLSIVSLGSILLLSIVIAIVTNQEWSKKVINSSFDFITSEFGIFYIVILNASLVFLAILAFGKYGKIVLGDTNSNKDYSDFSWASMLFCTGIGGAILYWGATEWVSYYQNPPYSLSPRSERP
jgi:Choline-glycine betaine transporter